MRERIVNLIPTVEWRCCQSPRWYTINQYWQQHNMKINHEETMWHNIFVHPVFTCAPTSYVTGCVDQHLDGSSVWPSSHLPLKACPARHHRTPLSSEVTQWHAQSTRVAFGAPPRKAQEPLTINWRWPRIIFFSCQCLQQSPSQLAAVLSKSNKKTTGYTTHKCH
jgi:hypothetical protein